VKKAAPAKVADKKKAKEEESSDSGEESDGEQ